MSYSMASSNVAHSKKSLRRIEKELKRVTSSPIEGTEASVRDKDPSKWSAVIDGPENSPYEGGKFKLDIDFPPDYPFSPPRVKFRSKVYHCNVSGSGDICVDILKDGWSPALSIQNVLLSLISLLTDPNPDDPYVGSIAKEYKTNRAKHDKTARQWTKKYAKP